MLSHAAIPQRLKPRPMVTLCGAAEVAPPFYDLALREDVKLDEAPGLPQSN